MASTKQADAPAPEAQPVEALTTEAVGQENWVEGITRKVDETTATEKAQQTGTSMPQEPDRFDEHSQALAGKLIHHIGRLRSAQISAESDLLNEISDCETETARIKDESAQRQVAIRDRIADLNRTERAVEAALHELRS